MKRVFTKRRILAGALSLAMMAAGVSATVRGEGDKTAPKKDAAKKNNDVSKKVDASKAPAAANPLADIEGLLKQMAPVLDEESLKEMQARMEEARKELERAMQGMQRQRGFMPMLPRLPRAGWGRPGRLDGLAANQEPRLGAQVSKPSKTLEDQLDLPNGQGIVLEEVGANSAAAKAGLKAHDILLELAGKPVSSKPEEFVKMIQNVKPNTPVNAVVMRKGKKETINGLSLPEAKAVAKEPLAFSEIPGMPALPAFGGFRGFRGLGAVGGLDGSTSISRNNDDFTAKHENGGVKITVKGKIDEGKAKVSEVQIESKGKTNKYESVDKVPAEYTEKVKKLTEMSAKGGLQLQLQIP